MPDRSKKLTLETVQEARARHYVHGESLASLARVFKVSPSAMRSAVYGETWKHVPIAYKRIKTT